MSFSFSCTRVTSVPAATSANALIRAAIWVGPLGDEEGEKPDVRRLEELGDVNGVPHPLQMRREFIVDGYLADGRTNTGNPQPVLGQNVAQGGQLTGVEVEDVDSPRAADLDVAQAKAGSDLALLGEVIGDLVDES